VHVGKDWDPELGSKDLGLFRNHVTNTSEPTTQDLILAEKRSVTLSNATAAYEAEIKHFSISSNTT